MYLAGFLKFHYLIGTTGMILKCSLSQKSLFRKNTASISDPAAAKGENCKEHLMDVNITKNQVRELLLSSRRNMLE